MRPTRPPFTRVSAILLPLSLVAGLSSPASAAVRVDIEGVSDELAETIGIAVGEPARETPRGIERFIDDVPQRARQTLSALGYYAADIDVTSQEVVRKDRPDSSGKASNDTGAPNTSDTDTDTDSDSDSETETETEPNTSANTSAKTSANTGANTGNERSPAIDTDEEDDAASNATRSSRIDTIVTLRITPNEPVRIKDLVLVIDGPASDDPAYMPIVSEITLRPGAVFVSGEYEAAKSVLLDHAQELGYFQFRFTTSEARVSRRQLTADITLRADSGPRYTFGPIEFDQNLFSQEFLDRWVPFNEGEPYDAALVGEMTDNFQASGYFASVRVRPQRDRRYGRTVPVRVNLRLKEENQIGIGVGYATDTGPRTKLTWGKPHINRRGHSAEAELGISAEQQNVGVAYRIPRKNQPLYNYYGINFGLQNDDTEETPGFLSRLTFERVSRTRSLWIESLLLRWERERFTISGVENTTDLVMPGFTYSRTRSKGSPFADWGQATSFQFLYGNKDLLSSIDFYKSVLNFKYLRALAPAHAFIGSVQYGAISSNDFSLVPPSQRFFAGGDRTVRGFKYRELSPTDDEGTAIGGRYLEVLSIEYNYRFRERWSLAVFADTGRAFDEFDAEYAAGAGVGFRWQSPVGPLRVDLAKPISEGDEDRGIRLHLSLGPDL